MKYTSRGLRRREGTDRWEVTLSHKDPVTRESIPTYHTVTARTRKQAERKRNELILELERRGTALSSKMTVRDYLTEFVAYKRGSGTVEPSTIRGYEKEARQISKHIGDIRLTDLAIPDVNAWMAQMIDEGYAAETVTKDFRLLNQALKYAQAQDPLAKNPCTFCKAPKRSRRKINTLDRAERSRMLELTRRAQPELLGMAIELALTTGMRHTFATSKMLEFFGRRMPSNHTALGRCATNRAVTLVCRLDLLCLVKLAVLVARFHELLVGAVGEHLPLVDEEDGIGVGSVYEA